MPTLQTPAQRRAQLLDPANTPRTLTGTNRSESKEPFDPEIAAQVLPPVTSLPDPSHEGHYLDRDHSYAVSISSSQLFYLMRTLGREESEVESLQTDIQNKQKFWTSVAGADVRYGDKQWEDGAYGMTMELMGTREEVERVLPYLISEPNPDHAWYSAAFNPYNQLANAQNKVRLALAELAAARGAETTAIGNPTLAGSAAQPLYRVIDEQLDQADTAIRKKLAQLQLTEDLAHDQSAQRSAAALGLSNSDMILSPDEQRAVDHDMQVLRDAREESNAPLTPEERAAAEHDLRIFRSQAETARPYDELTPEEQRALDKEMADANLAAGGMSKAEIDAERYQDATDSIYQEAFEEAQKTNDKKEPIAVRLTEEQTRLLISGEYPNDIRARSQAIYNMTNREKPVNIMRESVQLDYSDDQKTFFASLDAEEKPSLDAKLTALQSEQDRTRKSQSKEADKSISRQRARDKDYERD